MYQRFRLLTLPHGKPFAAKMRATSSVQNVLDHFAGRRDPALIVNKDALP
jgi:hypothetical protein